MASEYDEHIANLRRVNDLLQQALQQVQALLRQVELENRESVQENETVEGAPASPPSA
jgi:predicted ribosome quality control (RQC) complex YloA/Tae2 family protein